MKKFKINTDVGEFETLDDATEYFLDNAASFANDIVEDYNND